MPKVADKDRKIKKRCRWNPIFLVRVYKLAKLGFTDVDIEKDLGVSHVGFYKWKKEHPELEETLVMARKEKDCGETLADWIFSRLSPELKSIWQKIGRLEKKIDGVARISALLSGHGKVAKQELFLYALCSHHFSRTRAMKKVGITKGELDEWISTDNGFAKLVEEMEWHKGNFFEDSLVKLVQEGNPVAVVFANKTFNRGRGYGTHSSVDVNVNGQMLHGVLDLSELIPMLSDGCKTELLSAIRRRDEQKAIMEDPESRFMQQMEMEILKPIPGLESKSEG